MEKPDNQTSGVTWYSGSDPKVPQTPVPLKIINSAATGAPAARAAVSGAGILDTGGGTLRTPGGTPTTAFVPILRPAVPLGGPGSVLNAGTGVFGGLASAIREGAAGSIQQGQPGFVRSGPSGLLTDPALTTPSVAAERPFTASKSAAGGDPFAQDKAAWLNNAYKGIASDGTSASTAQRQIQCPNCSGSFLVKYAGRLFSSLCGWLQKTFKIRVSIIQTIKNYVIERVPVSKRSAFQGSCPYCGGAGSVPDPSDDRAKYAAAAGIAQGYTQEIQENEAKLGTGGNRYTIIQNHEVKEVGLGMNDVQSYRVDYEKGYRNWGLSGWGKKGVNPKYGPIPKGAKKNHIQGVNPVASPGGQYTVKCSNKFVCMTGALGFEVSTGGPVTINGGITRITGPEVTIGTQTGTLGLEGEVVNIKGKSVEVGPTDGHFFVRGTISNTGNLITGGHAHFESASIGKLETVGRNEPSKVSATNNLYSGPAFWGGKENQEGLKAALQEFLGFVLNHTTNPEMSKYIASLRYEDGLLDNASNLTYMALPLEEIQTGIARLPDFLGGELLALAGLELPVYNFPHIHANFDQPHYHETRVPDIDCSSDTIEELRSKQAGIDGPAPIHKKSTSIIDVLVSIWEAIGLLLIPLWYPFTKNIRNKNGGSTK